MVGDDGFAGNREERLGDVEGQGTEACATRGAADENDGLGVHGVISSERRWEESDERSVWWCKRPDCILCVTGVLARLDALWMPDGDCCRSTAKTRWLLAAVYCFDEPDRVHYTMVVY